MGEIVILMLVTISYYVIFNKKKEFIKEINSKAIYHFIVKIGIYLLISKLIWEYDKNIILNNLLVYMIWMVSTFLLQLHLYSYVTKITEEKKVLEMQNQCITIVQDTIEEIKGRQHDFKNTINTINGIIEVSDEKDLKYQLKNHMKSLNFADKSMEDILYINNVTIKAIVYNKSCEAERLNIKFLYNVNDIFLEDKLKNHEVSDILNNLLNNAFEAVQIEDNSNKTVILNILTENNKDIIEVRNNGIPIKKDINSIFMRGFSTKKENNRGYGLYNVKKIVERKRGNIQLFLEDNYTVFKVLL